MTIDAQTDSAAFFATADWTPELYREWADRIHASRQSREEFDARLANAREQGGGDLPVAIGLMITGRYGEALEHFARAGQSKARYYFAGQAAAVLGRYADALADFRRAADAGWDALEADMESALVLMRSGDPAAARRLIQKHAGAGVDRPLWHFADGMLKEIGGEHEAALEAYERALTLDPDDPRIMFATAYLYDLHGNDAEAIDLYRRLSLQPAAHVNALMNLAVLYEDQGRYDEAAACVQRVLASNPNHVRARLFFKDIESSRTMSVDDERQRAADSRVRLLETPISDFDLSVRARNCLKKMNVDTLGDLLRTTEDELLAYKNFGDTTLSEIKALLARLGLTLGQGTEPAPVAAPAAPPPPPVHVPPGREAVLSRPVSELELSVRSRKCLQRLNINTVGELVAKSDAELLAVRNFGVTSLNEIKARLADLGLSLAGGAE